MGGACRWGRDVVSGFISNIPLPKEAVLVNARLGVLYKFLQFIALCGAAYFISQNYYSIYAPSHVDIEFWREEGQTAISQDSHCSDVAAYHYNYSGTIGYKPLHCEALMVGEDYLQATDSMFFSTLVSDTTVRSDSGAACADLRTKCGARSGTYEEQPAEQNGGTVRCRCSMNDEFLVENQEARAFVFRHSYQVQDSFMGDSMQSGSSSAPFYLTGKLGSQVRVQKQMVTRIIKEDGSPCLVGGKSEYKPEDGDIHGTVAEWLACGDLTLDTRSDLTKSNLPDETGAPHVRISGAKVRLGLRYHNWGPGVEGNVNTVCEITVHARPAWVSRIVNDHTILPDSLESESAGRHRSRYMHGVEFTFKRDGAFYFFTPYTLVTGIVNAVVLVSLPVQAIRLVALYGIGVVSTIYSSVLRQRFSIFHQFHGMTARMMVAAIGFRALTKQWNTKVEDLEPMRMADVELHLEEALHHDLKTTDADGNPILNKNEARMLATVVTAGLDTDNGGRVSFEEFVKACSSNEYFDTQTMIKFFDEDREHYERVFDPTRAQIESIHRKRRKLRLSHSYAEEDQDVEAVRSEKSSKLVVTAAKSILDSPVFSVQSVRRTQI